MTFFELHSFQNFWQMLNFNNYRCNRNVLKVHTSKNDSKHTSTNTLISPPAITSRL